uniref:Nuclear receptor domain-containing protein n=1 Tax=Ascaris lumbricoides TaxID=6252 RepID=A0A0M3HU61_ASCLU
MLKYGCRICKAQATGFHFDAQSCSACAAFFRRTVALNRHFNCITGCNNCFVHYSVRQICRACRFRRCLEEGMKKNCVQPKKTEWEKRRAFCTKSGLKRNKKFAIKLHVNTITNEQYEIANSPITQYSIIAGSSTSSSSPQTESLSCCPERFSDDWDVATSPVDASKCWCRSVSDTPSDIKIDHKYLAPKYDVSNANYRSLQVICCGIRELL